ncbi:uncharacterized protein LOC121141962 [Mesocricetus auratus]|uniref:Uncharacterized protein LOC121141962 n=1 Tax=Mesocricetus auratus TaxID=10036 RepID=A0ABM2XW19_MESAU|nr:uncharacterized protein LOC121141962 [Mesocricetus auratus]
MLRVRQRRKHSTDCLVHTRMQGTFKNCGEGEQVQKSPSLSVLRSHATVARLKMKGGGFGVKIKPGPPTRIQKQRNTPGTPYAPSDWVPSDASCTGAISTPASSPLSALPPSFCSVLVGRSEEGCAGHSPSLFPRLHLEHQRSSTCSLPSPTLAAVGPGRAGLHRASFLPPVADVATLLPRPTGSGSLILRTLVCPGTTCMSCALGGQNWVSETYEIKLQTIMSHHVVVGNQTWVLWKIRQSF